MIVAMMGMNGNDEPQTTRDVEKAVANMEKAVASAAVVALDQEVRPGEADEPTVDEDRGANKLSFGHWVWIIFQGCYSLYMIVTGSYFECDSVATLRTWAIVWGLGTFLANVVAPLRGWSHGRNPFGSHMFVCFILLYIWGSSAIFPNWDPDHQYCNNNLFWPCAWSLVGGMAFSILAIVLGVVCTKCCRGRGMARCPASASS